MVVAQSPPSNRAKMILTPSMTLITHKLWNFSTLVKQTKLTNDKNIELQKHYTIILFLPSL